MSEHSYEMTEHCPYWRCSQEQTFGWFGSDEDGEFRCLECDHTLSWARSENSSTGATYEEVRKSQAENRRRVGRHLYQ